MSKIVPRKIISDYRHMIDLWRKEVSKFQASNQTSGGEKLQSTSTGASNMSVSIGLSDLTLSAFQSQILQVYEKFLEEVFIVALKRHVKGQKKLSGIEDLKMKVVALWRIRSKKTFSEEILAKSILEAWYGSTRLPNNMEKILDLNSNHLKTLALHRSLRNMCQHKRGLFDAQSLPKDKSRYRVKWYCDEGKGKKITTVFKKSDTIKFSYKELGKLLTAIDDLIRDSKFKK